MYAGLLHLSRGNDSVLRLTLIILQLRLVAGEVESRDAVADRAQQLAEAALSEGAQQGNIALLRSSAEMFALAACISSDGKAIALLRSLCSSTASSSAPPR